MPYSRVPSIFYFKRNSSCIYWACICCSSRVSQGSPAFPVTCVQQLYSCTVYAFTVPALGSLPELLNTSQALNPNMYRWCQAVTDLQSCKWNHDEPPALFITLFLLILNLPFKYHFLFHMTAVNNDGSYKSSQVQILNHTPPASMTRIAALQTWIYKATFQLPALWSHILPFLSPSQFLNVRCIKYLTFREIPAL